MNHSPGSNPIALCSHKTQGRTAAEPGLPTAGGRAGRQNHFLATLLASGLLGFLPGAPCRAASQVITSGGALGTLLSPGPIDVDGDGTADITFVSIQGVGYLDASAPYGLTGNIGGNPGIGAAWARGTSILVPGDGVGRNEFTGIP